MARARRPAGLGARVQADGLRPLLRDLNRVNREVAKEVRAELKEGPGRLVADEAQRIARDRLKQRSGRTVRRINPSVRGSVVEVRNTAVRKGFHYPNVLEFGWRGASTVGPYASLHPALDNKEDEVVESFADVLGRLSDRAGFH